MSENILQSITQAKREETQEKFDKTNKILKLFLSKYYHSDDLMKNSPTRLLMFDFPPQEHKQIHKQNYTQNFENNQQVTRNKTPHQQ